MKGSAEEGRVRLSRNLCNRPTVFGFYFCAKEIAKKTLYKKTQGKQTWKNQYTKTYEMQQK